MPWEPPDADKVEDSLAALNFAAKGSVIWQFLTEIDPVELQKSRDMQKMILARYGRQNVLQWRDVDVVEIARYARALEELIHAENDLHRISEE